MDPWWGSKLEVEDSQLEWKMRGVNGEADFETNWSSFQSLRREKQRGFEGWRSGTIKEGKNQDRRGVFFFFFFREKIMWIS